MKDADTQHRARCSGGQGEDVLGGVGGVWVWVVVCLVCVWVGGEALGDGFERTPLGLRGVTWEALRADTVRAYEAVRAELNSFFDENGGWLWTLNKLLPLLLLAGVGGAWWWFEHRAKAARKEVLRWLPAVSNPHLLSIRNSILNILTRAMPFALALLPLYVPLKLIYVEAAWVDLAARLLWVGLIYRGMVSVVEDVLLGDILKLPRPPLALKRWFHTGLKVAVVLWTAKDVTEIVGASQGGEVILGFALRLWITFWVARLVSMTDDLLLVLSPLRRSPPKVSAEDAPTNLAHSPDNKTRYVKAFIGFAVLMLFFWSVGYVGALTHVLTRVTVALGIFLLATFAYRRAQRWVHAQVERQLTPEGEPRDREHHAVLRAVERSVLSVGSAVLSVILLQTLGLWESVVALASDPALELGASIRISIYAVAKGIFGMMIALFASHVLRAILYEKVYPRFEVDIGVGYAINTMAHYLMFTVGLILALDAVGVDVAALGLFFSALGVGIGLGLQPIVKNLMSGFILLFGRSLKKGDYITINNVYGRVDTVGARSVTITTPDNLEMIIPSADLISGPIINWTLSSPLARIKIPVGVAYGSDVQTVREVLVAAALRHPHIQRRPAPEAWIIGFEPSRIQFQLLFYIDCRQTNETRAVGEIYYHVWDALKEAHIQIPYPQTDLHIKSFSGEPPLPSTINLTQPTQEPEQPPHKDNTP
jgi:small-conductance mechanosensitive channel